MMRIRERTPSLLSITDSQNAAVFKNGPLALGINPTTIKAEQAKLFATAINSGINSPRAIVSQCQTALSPIGMPRTYGLAMW